MKRYKVIVFFLLAFPLFFAIERFCRWQTGGFRPSKVTCYLPHQFHKDLFSHSIADIHEVLSQPFSFLGRGVQCYAFVSKDGSTVLKLFKHSHFGPPSEWLHHLPFAWAHNIIEKRDRRLEHIYQSAIIATTQLEKETGVLYLHLEKTPGYYPTVTLYDKLNTAYSLDLNQCEFILQKRAKAAQEVIDEALCQGNVDKATECLFALLTFLKRQSTLGIKNKDPKILRNCGFIDDQPMLIDIGSLKMRSRSTHPDPTSKALNKAKAQTLRWIEKKHPYYHPFFKRLLNEKDSQRAAYCPFYSRTFKSHPHPNRWSLLC